MQSLFLSTTVDRIHVTKLLLNVMQSTPTPLSSVVGLQLEHTARGTHKRSPSAYMEEGYTVTMETGGPTLTADGGGEDIGGWVQ